MRYEQLELGVFDDNKRAQALYKSMDLKFGDVQRMHINLKMEHIVMKL